MRTCYLFEDALTETSCLSLCLDEQGKVEAALESRSFLDIQQLEPKQIIVVLPCSQFSLYQVELPLLSEKEARAAIPFALEDKLAQPIETLHFAFSRTYYKNHHYLVAVCKATYLNQVIERLDHHSIQFNEMTLDWFALKPQEISKMPGNWLVNNEHVQGALSAELASIYLKKISTEQKIYIFKDNNASLVADIDSSCVLTQIKEPSNLWVAKRLQNIKPMNICQGIFRRKNSNLRWYQATLIMTLIWLISFLTVNAIKLYVLNKEIAKVDQSIAQIYYQFFPQAKQIISPRFRISQLLKTTQTTDNILWNLMDLLAKTINNSTTTIEELRFQNQLIQVTLQLPTFQTLEKLELQLQKTGVKVKQLKALAQNQHVIASLELSL